MSWATKKIGDVLSPLENGKLLHQGWSPRCEADASLDHSEWAVLKTTSVQDGWFDDSYNKRLPKTLSARPNLEVHAGDILITCAGPRGRCGIACFVEKTRPRLIMSGKMYRFRSNESVIAPEFLVAYLRSSGGQAAIDQMKTGGNESGLNLTHERFFRLQIPVAPLAEQYRIIEHLRELIFKTRYAHSEVTRIPRLSDRYRRAVLASAMSRDERGIEWPRVPLKDLISDGPTNGFSPRSGDNPVGTLSLKLSATTRGVLDLSERAVKRLNVAIEQDSKYWLRPGDILIQRANSID
jgi:type I restriction enzyme S subunit